MRVREVNDLAALLKASTDAPMAVDGLGALRERVGDWLWLVSPREPRYAEVRLETSSSGALAGIVVALGEPEHVRWDQLEARFGAAVEVPDGLHESDVPASRAYDRDGADEPTLILRRADEERVWQVILRKKGVA